MKQTMPRPPLKDQPPSNAAPMPQPRGFGMRYAQPLLPTGEAARRDPHIPDPIPGLHRPPQSQSAASPPVSKVGHLHAGGAVSYEGQVSALVYVKRIGTLVTRSLGREFLAAAADARWRVGGVSWPVSSGVPGIGPGYHGDAATLWPDNPQTFLRNPGIRPTVGVPQTYRYAPNMKADLGPTIADFGLRPNFATTQVVANQRK